MIPIKRSLTADNRSCDYTKVTREQLLASSRQHIHDVEEALVFFSEKIGLAAYRHDRDKIEDIDLFHQDFTSGPKGFVTEEWWKNHITENRHHLQVEGGVPEDVNLIDVLEMICDCVMAGMGRTGTVYPLNIKPEVLTTAFTNTVEWLKSNVEVEES